MNRPVMTPEHLALLSTQKLEALASGSNRSDDSPDGGNALPPQVQRLAQFELRRRRRASMHDAPSPALHSTGLH
ncbi:MAG: hypothetical protein AAF170_16040 [Bacteroidota bacterium]